MPGTSNAKTRFGRARRNLILIAWKPESAYALAMSGNTASILVFRVAALNGLTI